MCQTCSTGGGGGGASVAGTTATVVTSTDGGLSAEQVTQLCCNKIIHVSENAAPAVKEQAAVFRAQLETVVYAYVLQAQKEERDTCVQIAGETLPYPYHILFALFT